MPRVAGVDIPPKKRIVIALTYIFGIGSSRAQEIVKAANVNPDARAESLGEDDLAKIRSFIDSNFQVEGNLKREVTMSVKRLMDLGSYRGSRHKKRLPVRGQRSKTNARTIKGARKTVAGKKKAPTSK